MDKARGGLRLWILVAASAAIVAASCLLVLRVTAFPTFVHVPSKGPLLSGRVTDRAGAPLGDASIQAYCPSFASVAHSARTDADGRFQLRLDFSAAQYHVTARMSGYVRGEMDVISGETSSADFALAVAADSYSIAARVIDAATKKALADTDVELRGAAGFTANARTDAAGRFTLPVVPKEADHGLVVAGDKVSRFQPLLTPGAETLFEVDKAAKVTFIATSANSGKPIDGAVLRATLDAHHGFHAISAPDGTDRIDSLPPGIYSVTASADGFAHPTAAGLGDLPKEVRLLPGQELSLRVGFRPSGTPRSSQSGRDRYAAIRGRVVSAEGTPVAGARVFAQRLAAAVRTDNEGRFVAFTDEGAPRVSFFERLERAFEDRSVNPYVITASAYHSLYGVGEAGVVNPRAGGVYDVTITLGGAVRLRGVVRDKEGAPIPGVRIHAGPDSGDHSSYTTGADGRFDMGNLPATGLLAYFEAPRPTLPTSANGGADVAGQKWFHHNVVFPPAKKSGAIDLDVVLDDTPVITLSGSVTEVNGAPVPGALVVLCPDGPWGYKIPEVLHPERYSSSYSASQYPALARTMTNEKGEWTIYTIHHWSLGLDTRSNLMPYDMFAIAAEGPNGDTAVSNAIRVNPGEREKSVDLILEPKASPQGP